MNPEKPINQPSPEQLLVKTIPSIENIPESQSGESNIEKSAERYEQKSELSAATSDAAITTTPTASTTSDSTVVNDTSQLFNPSTANDEDLIEKEWVDRAKKIIADTPNDPHKREQEVSKLQSDYIKKRYGRELGVS